MRKKLYYKDIKFTPIIVYSRLFACVAVVVCVKRLLTCEGLNRARGRLSVTRDGDVDIPSCGYIRWSSLGAGIQLYTDPSRMSLGVMRITRAKRPAGI